MSGCRALVSVVKTCQRCGTPFDCGLSCCWCDELTLTAGTREALRREYSDCLCRACLTVLSPPQPVAGRPQ